MDANIYCQQKVAASHSSFYYSFLLLPPAQRQAMFNLYAFCREVDDIVDECSEPSIAQTKLNWWRDQIHQIYKYQRADQDLTTLTNTSANQANDIKKLHPIAQALVNTIKIYHLPEIYFLDIIDGMAQDLNQSRYLDFQQLEQYCWRAAGAVGTLSIYILSEDTKPNTVLFEYAKNMGLALQLINIIRDVGEDARLGRIYLPVNELQRFDVPAHTILKQQNSEAFIKLMKWQGDRAKMYYQKALDILNTLPKKQIHQQKAGLLMGAIYKALLDAIEQENYPVLKQKISLPRHRKLWICIKTWFKYII
jgi:15-cis-phytoene synthase